MIFIVDFDGTIAPDDTVDLLLGKFADPSWESIEADWVSGKFGSKTCMKRQLSLVTADQKSLEAFFHAVEIDPTFVNFVRYVGRFADVVIASDGLDYPIHHAMRNAGIASVPVFANKLRFVPGGLDISFPHELDSCASQSGVCKCAVARSFDSGPIVLIGDGRSDHCLARSADHVFAKGPLQRFCENENILYTPFMSFSDITNIVQQWNEARFVVAKGKQYVA